MEPKREPAFGGLPAPWAGAVVAKLESLGRNIDLYRTKTIRERVLDAMTSVNIDSVVQWANRNEGLTRLGIMTSLGIDVRSLQRAVAGEVVTHPRGFFGAIYVALRREVWDLELPESRDALERAVYVALRVIRHDMFGKSPREPRRDEIILVRQLLRHPNSNLFLPEAPPVVGQTLKAERERVIKEVIRGARAYGSGPAVATAAAAVVAVEDWAFSYAALRFGLPLEVDFVLEVFDEKPR
jgi:hypothetical protein